MSNPPKKKSHCSPEMDMLKRLVKEGYKLKVHHIDKEWRNALEDAERLIIKSNSDDETN